mgnify:CR=1 FL=1
MKSSKFHFVDLAGSERQKSTAATGDRLKEAGNINKSLTVLGKVINTLVLSAQGKSVHVAYRESKLTFLLKDSLGGNSKTCIIANVSPSSSAFSETLSTLKFAQNAKQIKNKASINEDSQGGLDSLKNEIKRLKEELILANTKIANLQKDPGLRSPKWTPQHNNSFNEKQIFADNQRAMEIEKALKDSLNFLTDNEMLLQTELAKKEEYIKIFQSAAEFYNSNELQYKTIINLQFERNQRYTEVFGTYTHSIDVNGFLKNENSLLKKENASFLEIVRNTPAVITTFIENVSLKEALDEKEGETNPNSSLSVAIQLQENLFFLQDLSHKLEENIKERKLLSDRIKRISGGQGLVSPTTERERDDIEKQLIQAKQQMGAQIDSLNLEIATRKQQENQLARLLTLEKEKSARLSEECEKLTAEKERERKVHEERIRELAKSFESKQTATADQMEKKLSEQNFKNIELRNKIQDLQHDLEGAQSKLSKQQAEKEELEARLKTYFEESSQERSQLQNTIKDHEFRINTLNQEVSRHKAESESLVEKMREVFKENNDLQLMLSEAMKMAEDLRVENDNLKGLKSEEIEQLEKELEQERGKFEIADSERRKLQEELDTVTQALEYNSNELIEKKMTLANLTVQNSQLSSLVEELRKQANGKDELIEALERKITAFNDDENSSFNIALRDNKRMRTEIDEMRARFEGESKRAQAQRQEIESLKTLLEEARRSESDFKIAYQELHEKFQKSNSEAKLREIELNNKNGELAEMQKNLSESQHRYNKLEEAFKRLESDHRAQKDQFVAERSALISEIDIQKRLLSNELEMQSQNLTRMEERYNQANKEISAQRKEFDAILESSKKNFNATCKKLTESLKIMQEEMDRIQKAQASLENKGLQSDAQLQQLRDILGEKEQELAQKNEEIQRYSQKIASITEKGSQNQAQEISRLTKQNQNLEELIQKERESSEALKAELQEKEAELATCKENLKQLKEQFDKYWETIDQINDKGNFQEENEKLKKKIESQNEIIESLNRHASDNYKYHEEEIEKIRESYAKLESQHQFIMATASIKDSEVAKSKEEIKLMLLEKSKLISEING